MVERVSDKDEVNGSIPLPPTHKLILTAQTYILKRRLDRNMVKSDKSFKAVIVTLQDLERLTKEIESIVSADNKGQSYK